MAGANGKPVVVLVEDEPAMAQGVRLNLEIDGYEVHHFTNGPQALKELERLHGNTILLCDHMLVAGPNGKKLTGLEVIREARKMHANIRSILYTAAAPEIQQEAEAEGIHFLPKPFTLTKLIAEVNAARDRVQQGASPSDAIVQDGPTALVDRARQNGEQGRKL